MTESEQSALNERIALWVGYTKIADGNWVDPGGIGGYPKPPNYTDNSGLWVGLKYKLRRLGWNINIDWPAGQSVTITISKAEQSFVGTSDTESLAGCIALANILP